MKKFFKSLRYSLRGLKKAYQEEPNFRIHIFSAILAIFFASWLRISLIEWLILLIIIAVVFSLEIVNSIFERVIDMLKPSLNQYVKDMKDMMAASVLVVAILAIVYAILVFLPKIISSFS